MRRRKVNVFSDPELLELLGRDPELLAIADAIAETQRQPTVARSRRRQLLLVAAIFAGILLIALPALAAFTSLIDFSSAPPAPAPVVKRFDDLQRQAPPNMDPRVIANEARRLDLATASTTVPLFLAPTRTGGYCFELAGYASGCNAERSVPVSVGFAAPDGISAPGIVYGSVLDPKAADAVLTAADGTERKAHLTRVSAPIRAAFFAVRIDNPERQLPLTVQIRDNAQQPIAVRTIPRPPTP